MQRFKHTTKDGAIYEMIPLRDILAKAGIAPSVTRNGQPMSWPSGEHGPAVVVGKIADKPGKEPARTTASLAGAPTAEDRETAAGWVSYYEAAPDQEAAKAHIFKTLKDYPRVLKLVDSAMAPKAPAPTAPKPPGMNKAPRPPAPAVTVEQAKAADHAERKGKRRAA
jgi:hypothetical protein